MEKKNNLKVLLKKQRKTTKKKITIKEWRDKFSFLSISGKAPISSLEVEEAYFDKFD